MSRQKRIQRSGKIQRKQLRRRPSSGKNTNGDQHRPEFNINFKLSDELREKFVEAVRLGLPPARACDLIGIGESTYYRWMHKGKSYYEQLEEGDQNDHHLVYYKFYRSVLKAAAEWQLEFVVRLGETKVEKEWYRNISVLERRDPQNWGKRPDQVSTEGDYSPDESFL